MDTEPKTRVSCVYVNPNDFYAIVGNHEYVVSYSSCVGNTLSPISVFNGLSVTGWLVYEMPSSLDYGAFHMFWDHPANVTVQYAKT